MKKINLYMKVQFYLIMKNEIWTEKREKVRKQVNEWIRNTKSEDKIPNPHQKENNLKNILIFLKNLLYKYL